MKMCVLVFGTFDGLHPGHLFFLQSAKACGTKLVVALARDHHVKLFKHKEPQHKQDERMSAVQSLSYVDEVILSDDQPGVFHVIDLIRPDIIVLGYDQNELFQVLSEWLQLHHRVIPIIRIKKQPIA